MRRLAAVCCLLLSAPALAEYEAGRQALARGDYARALAELVPVADRDARAALVLAQMYERGEGVTPDAHQALLWRRQAAELGDTNAQFDLAGRFDEGRDVTADPRAAAHWYERAARQGHADAGLALGTMLEQGRGVPPDRDAGRRWIEQAAAAGSRAARERMAWAGAGVSPGTVTVTPSGAAPSQVQADGPASDATSPEDPHRYSERTRPHIDWHWGLHYGRGWYRPGWYPYGGWYPHGWYPYGHTFLYPGYPGYPRSGIHFGFSFGR